MKRAVARLIDVMIVFSPAVVYCIWQIYHSTNSELWQALMIRPEKQLIPSLELVVGTAAIWLVTVLMTTVWAQSPGKWMCGIYVCRATRRPCGFHLVLLRELLLWLDAPLLLTGMPGLISILLTDRQQRIGDLIADTVVLNGTRSTHRQHDV